MVGLVWRGTNEKTGRTPIAAVSTFVRAPFGGHCLVYVFRYLHGHLLLVDLVAK